MSALFPEPAFPSLAMKCACVDKDAGKIESLKAGRMPIYEPGLEEVVADNVKSGPTLLRHRPLKRTSSPRMPSHRGGHAVAARRRSRRPHLCFQAAEEIAAG